MLTVVQVSTLMQEAAVDASGQIDYSAFVTRCAPLLCRIYDSNYRLVQAPVEETAVVQPDPDVVAAARKPGRPRRGSILHEADPEGVMKAIFKAADDNGNGVLDRKEFLQIMRQADLGLTSKDLNLLLAEADINDDGTVNYMQFVPIAMDVIKCREALTGHKEEMTQLEVAATEAAVQTLHGMPREVLEEAMLNAFMSADTNNNGSLDAIEFKRALESMWLDNTRLTKKEVNMIFASIDVNSDGTVSYAEFVQPNGRTRKTCPAKSKMQRATKQSVD